MKKIFIIIFTVFFVPCKLLALPAVSKDHGHFLPYDLTVPGKSFVSSGPYIGVPIYYSGGHLIINSPSVNQDFSLLKLRYGIRKHLRDVGVLDHSNSAHLLLSGVIEGQSNYQTSGTGTNSSDINLSSAGIDAYVMGPGEWISALIALSFDGAAGPSKGTFSNNSRTQNSRVYVSQAFLTIGSLAKTSIYGTVGQLYVPFGTFSSNMVSSPLTKAFARTKARALVLGYHSLRPNDFYASTYIFRGDSHSGSASRINNGGVNLGYQFRYAGIRSDIGVGIIGNIADSEGMQNNGNSDSLFNGFGGTGSTGNEQITHRVPAVNLRAMLNAGKNIKLLAEYVTAIRAFSNSDLTFNSHAAKPYALNAEAAFTFKNFEHPSSIAVGYGLTQEALALGLSAKRYSVVYNTSFWRDTLQSLEFKHEQAYAASNTATGSGIAAAIQNGRADNVVTAQIDVYF